MKPRTFDLLVIASLGLLAVAVLVASVDRTGITPADVRAAMLRGLNPPPPADLGPCVIWAHGSPTSLGACLAKEQRK